MARCEIKLPDDMEKRLSRLADKTDEIIPKVLEVGGEVVANKVKSNLQAMIGNGIKEKSRSTGQLVSALGVTTAKQDKEGNYNVKVGFSEPRRNGKSNAMIAGVLEYGKHGQSPKPFLKPAKSASKSACINAMKEKFEEEVNKL